MIEISDHAELRASCDGDMLCLWAAQGLREQRPGGRSRAWRSEDGTALAVAGSELSTRDRIAVWGRADTLVRLTRDVLDVVGPSYRPLGDPDLLAALLAGIPGLARGASFGWMDCRSAVPAAAPDKATGPAPVRTPAPLRTDGPRWLADTELTDVSELMQVSFPDSDAQPGGPGVERWAGIRDDQGRLVAIAAHAWSAPDVGYLAGIAVHPKARRQGYGAAVCGFVLAEALAKHGAAALMVDEWNDSAIRLYRGLGMGYRPLAAAFVAS